jgi:DNA-binding SARP family transcriptional activator
MIYGSDATLEGFNAPLGHQPPHESPMTIQLLNGFSLRRGTIRVRLPGSAERLVAYLALVGPTNRSRLCGQLWPDVPEKSARASLRNALWLVAQKAPGLLEIVGNTVQLASHVMVDLAEFRSWAWPIVNGSVGHLVEADLQSVLSALGDAELLPGWYEDWSADPREQMRQLRMHALESLSATLLAERRFALALQLALEVARMEPLRESAAAAVIAVHLRERNTVEAVRYFNTFARELRSELGVEPSEDLSQLLPGNLRASA